MKTSVLFWGVLLITIGIFIILNNFGLLNFNFDYVFKLWPLILIIWGLTLLKIDEIFKKILSVVSALLLTLLVVALIKHDWWGNFDVFDDHSDWDDSAYESTDYSTTFSYPLTPDVKLANLNFSGAAQSIYIAEDSSQLFWTECNSYISEPKYDLKALDNSLNIDFKTATKLKIGRNSIGSRDIHMNLGTDLPWKLNLKIGAANLEANFSKINIKTLNLDAGAADIDLTLGDIADSSFVEIKTGASNVTITVPYSAGCELNSKFGLSSYNIDGFTTPKKNLYVTDNFDTASKKIFIKFKSGISDFTIRREYAADSI